MYIWMHVYINIYMFVCAYIYIYIYIFTNPSIQAGCNTWPFFFRVEFGKFEFKVFLLLDRSPYKG